MTSTFDVVNPFTGQPFAQAPDFTDKQADEAVQKARRAFGSWSSKTWDERVELLSQCAEKLMENQKPLAELLTKEQGKPLMQSNIEVLGSYMWFQRALQRQNPNKILVDNPKLLVEQRYKPVGVVAAIVPWNFPILLVHFKISEALLAGCTIVLKPSEYTPLTALYLGKIYNEILPEGVFNVVSGIRKELGAYLVNHPGIDKISFTGSTAVGKSILQNAGFRKVTLELGGNDAMIILKDVDPKKIAPHIIQASFFNCGQICLAAKRVFVHKDIFDQVAEEVKNLLSKQVAGNGLEKKTTIGPVNNAMQYNKVRDYLVDAIENGAEIIYGSVPPPLGDNGYVFPPVLLKNVKEGVRIVDEEQFGPVLPLLPYDSIDEVVARANSTSSGLGGSVWTNNIELGTEIASKLECGTSWVNSHADIIGNDDAPFGGVKTSGVGLEGGHEGLLGFMNVHVVKVKRSAKL